MLTFVNRIAMLSFVNILHVLTFVTIGAHLMPRLVTPASVGVLVRDARTAAGLSQSELGARIGASRFWVAQFEKGKPSAELGLALKALRALGLEVRVEGKAAMGGAMKGKAASEPPAGASPLPQIDLGVIIAAHTLTPKSKVTKARPSGGKGRRPRRGA